MLQAQLKNVCDVFAFQEFGTHETQTIREIEK